MRSCEGREGFQGRGREGECYRGWGGYYLRETPAGQHTFWFLNPHPERLGWEAPAFQAPVPATPMGEMPSPLVEILCCALFCFEHKFKSMGF